MSERFEVVESVGAERGGDDGPAVGDVLYTGYYTPIFKGSKSPSARYPYPLYHRPDDLVSDSITGEVKGRKTTKP